MTRHKEDRSFFGRRSGEAGARRTSKKASAHMKGDKAKYCIQFRLAVPVLLQSVIAFLFSKSDRFIKCPVHSQICNIQNYETKNWDKRPLPFPTKNKSNLLKRTYGSTCTPSTPIITPDLSSETPQSPPRNPGRASGTPPARRGKQGGWLPRSSPASTPE